MQNPKSFCYQVSAVAYDNPIPGFKTDNTINLRLWAAKPDKEFDLEAFNTGDYVQVGISWGLVGLSLLYAWQICPVDLPHLTIVICKHSQYLIATEHAEIQQMFWLDNDFPSGQREYKINAWNSSTTPRIWALMQAILQRQRAETLSSVLYPGNPVAACCDLQPCLGFPTYSHLQEEVQYLFIVVIGCHRRLSIGHLQDILFLFLLGGYAERKAIVCMPGHNPYCRNIWLFSALHPDHRGWSSLYKMCSLAQWCGHGEIVCFILIGKLIGRRWQDIPRQGAQAKAATFFCECHHSGCGEAVQGDSRLFWPVCWEGGLPAERHPSYHCSAWADEGSHGRKWPGLDGSMGHHQQSELQTPYCTSPLSLWLVLLLNKRPLVTCVAWAACWYHRDPISARTSEIIHSRRLAHARRLGRGWQANHVCLWDLNCMQKSWSDQRIGMRVDDARGRLGIQSSCR